MNFEFTGPQTEVEKIVGGHFCINAFGRIIPGDSERFEKFIAANQPPPRSPVLINSPGGDVDEAIDIGRSIRANWFSTEVGTYSLDTSADMEIFAKRQRQDGECLSAATLVFLGGRLRHLRDGTRFGVHQFSLKNPSPEAQTSSQRLSAKIARYVEDMGVSLEFLEMSSAPGPKELKLLERDELVKLGVITGGETEVSWSVQGRSNTLYVRGERDSIFGHHKIILGFAKGAGFYLHAVIEPQGREQELTSFGHIRIVMNGEDSKIDVSDRCERTIANGYVNCLVMLTESEVEQLASSDSFGLQVMFSSEADMFLGISAMDTSSGHDLLQSFVGCLIPQKCQP